MATIDRMTAASLSAEEAEAGFRAWLRELLVAGGGGPSHTDAERIQNGLPHRGDAGNIAGRSMTDQP
jgi:hypothetical protein